MPPKHQTVQEMFQQLAKKINRDDFELAVLYSPKAGYKYCLRFGLGQWVKDINPLTAVNMMEQKEEETLKETAAAHRELNEAKKTIELAEAIRLWQQVQPADPPANGF